MIDVDSRRKAKRIAAERNLVGFANDTKWAEFFKVVADKKIELEIKYIDSEVITHPAPVWVPSGNYVECAQMGPVLFVYVEWVRSMDIAAFSDLALTIGLEYIVNNGAVVVYGYK